MSRASIDLNVDAGESFGGWRLGQDELVFPFMSSANLACGFHAGDPLTIAKTIGLAKEHGVQVGAHPGLPDRVGFGRREMSVTPEEMHADVLYQLGALGGMLSAHGSKLHHVSPHGALAWMTWSQAPLAEAFVAAVRDYDPTLVLLALSGTEIEAVARREGVRTVLLGFPERGYLSDGRLAPRGSAGGVVTDPELAAMRALAMVREGRVQAVDGEWTRAEVDSLLIHGDNPAAPVIARRIHEALSGAGVEIRAF
jgi:UPF0271 protein